MAKGSRGYVVFLFVLFGDIIHTTKSLSYDVPENPKDLLAHLMGNDADMPVVVMVDTQKQQRILESEDLVKPGDVGLLEDEHEKAANDDAKNLLYHILRTTNQGDLDSSLEETKQVLRQALRSRCEKVDKCVKKCPKKKATCPENCQEVFDNLNLCKPPPKPKRPKTPKCGKTMPPSWRF